MSETQSFQNLSQSAREALVNAARRDSSDLLDGKTISSFNYAVDSGSTDAYVLTLVPAIPSYTTGMVVFFTTNTANTGAATLNINGLGVTDIVKGFNTVLDTNDIFPNMIAFCIYNGTSFVLMNPRAHLAAGLAPSGSASPSRSPSISPSASASRSPSISASASPSPTPSASASISPSASASRSPSISPSASASQSPSISPSASASISPSASASISPSASASRSPSISPSASASISPSASPSFER